MDSVESKPFIDSINKIVQDFLEIKHSPYVVYRTLNSAKFFKGNLNEQSIDAYFSNIENKYKEKDTVPPFKLGYYNKNIKENSILKLKISRYCNKIFENQRLIHIPRSQSKILRFNISDQNDIRKLREEYTNIEILRKLGMISAPEIDFVKNERISLDIENYIEEKYHVSESSSGEFNLLTSLIGLMACIKPNSLIFIDEPEVSLHPNWQMKYIHFLRLLFSSEEYKTCHILIATHSHFLISDLPGNYSKIIGVTKESGTLETIDFQYGINTYGWSAEEVLYKVFKVRTTRNYYLEMNLRELLHLVSVKSNDKQRIIKLLESLEDVQLNQEDPLRLVINSSKKYLNSL